MWWRSKSGFCTTATRATACGRRRSYRSRCGLRRWRGARRRRGRRKVPSSVFDVLAAVVLFRCQSSDGDAPPVDVGALPDLAHGEVGRRRGEVRPVDELLDALAADAEQLPDLGGPDEVMHVRDHRQQTTSHLTMGLARAHTSRVTSGCSVKEYAMTADWTPLAEAVAALAGACDGARADDGRGFNASDVPLGHYLAKIPADLWDDDLATAAHQLARTYKAQLLAAGIEFEDLPAPDEPEREVRDGVTERRRADREAARIAEQSFCFTATDGDRQVIVLGFPYQQDMVEESRNIPGRRFRDAFAGRAKVNTYPASSAAAVAGCCAAHGVPVDPAVEDLAALPPEELALAEPN